MKSFLETIQENQVLGSVNDLFISLEKKGISSQKFSNWLMEEGLLAEDFQKTAEHWIERELLFAESLGDRFNMGRDTANQNPIGHSNVGHKLGSFLGNTAQKAGHFATKMNQWGQAFSNSMNSGIDGNAPPQNTQTNAEVENAKKALDALSRQLGRSPALRQKVNDPKFASSVISLMQILNDPKSMNPSYSYESVDEIKSVLKEINENFDIDPLEILEWYSKEGKFLKEGFGDWFWNSSLGRWFGNKLNKWGGNAANRQNQYDDSAVQNALQALHALETSLGNLPPNRNLLDTLTYVKNKLNDLAGSAMQAQPQNNQQAQNPQAQPQNNQQAQNPAQSRFAMRSNWLQQKAKAKEIEDDRERHLGNFADHNILDADKAFLESVFGDKKASWFGG